jgi:hypothetical protein
MGFFLSSGLVVTRRAVAFVDGRHVQLYEHSMCLREKTAASQCLFSTGALLRRREANRRSREGSNGDEGQ